MRKGRFGRSRGGGLPLTERRRRPRRYRAPVRAPAPARWS